jgi:hypothetical protein
LVAKSDTVSQVIATTKMSARVRATKDRTISTPAPVGWSASAAGPAA